MNPEESSSASPKLSAEQRLAFASLTKVKLYKYDDTAPCLELGHEGILMAMSVFVEDLDHISGDLDLDAATRSKSRRCHTIAGQMKSRINSIGEYPAEERRYFAYALDDKPVGLLMAKSVDGRDDELEIEFVISNPGIRGAASALIEEALSQCGDDPKLSLTSIHGALGAYRRLGFFPRDTEVFSGDELKRHDDIFLKMSLAGASNLDRNTKQLYNSYRKMVLRPGESVAWEKSGGVWKFLPDGKKYLVENTPVETAQD